MASGQTFTMFAFSALAVLLLALGTAPTATAGPTSQVLPRPIPPGYRLYEGLGYYKLHYEWRNWFEAKARCEAEGGYLAVLNSQEEADLAASLMKQYEVPGAVWTGIADVTGEQVWVTSLGDPLSSTGYEVWAPGQPNEQGRALCLGLVPGKGLDDLYCRATERPFLCELID